MMILKVRRSDGNIERLTFDKPEIAIGRDAALNDVVIGESSVSKNHALIARTSNAVVLTDLNSTNGTLLNGVPIVDSLSLSATDEISVGSMKIWIDPETFTAPRRRYEELAPVPAVAPPSLTHVDTMASGGMPVFGATKSSAVTAGVRTGLAETGPIGPWFDDPQVSRIQCLRYDEILLTKGGAVGPADATFAGPDELHQVIVRLAEISGRRWRKGETLVERILPNGARLVAALPPIAESPTLTIEKVLPEGSPPPGVLDQAAATFLAAALREHRNLLVTGTDPRSVHHVASTIASDPEAVALLTGGDAAVRAASLAGHERVLVVRATPRAAAAAVCAIVDGASGAVIELLARSAEKGVASVVAELLDLRPGLSHAAASAVVASAVDVVVEVGAGDETPAKVRVAELGRGGGRGDEALIVRERIVTPRDRVG
jgi:hypothetical protein